jgi:3'-5' exoribonuclease
MTDELISSSYTFLRDTVKYVVNDTLRKACFHVLDNPRFVKCTASRKQHQSYDGGLVVHTAEVLDMAFRMAKAHFVEVDHDVLITAVIFHDYAKIYDYRPSEANAETGESPRTPYAYTEHQKLIRHLSHSYAEFMLASEGVDESLRDKIGHAILAHHGRQEWGSPVTPQTTEAHILHYADMMSAFCSKSQYKR